MSGTPTFRERDNELAGQWPVLSDPTIAGCQQSVGFIEQVYTHQEQVFTTKILETPMSTYKCGLRRIVQGRVARDLVWKELG